MAGPLRTQAVQGPMNWREHPSDQPSNYLPSGPPEELLFDQFNGINTSTTRPGVADDKMWWCDGFMPLGPRNLRTMWGVGDSFTLDTPISFFGFANIGTIPYCIMVFNDGSLGICNTETLFAGLIAPPGTISNPSRLTTGITQYGNQYIIIVTDQTDGYFIWDGTTFYIPGAAGPGGGTMPSGLGGTAVETYAGRVWIANGDEVIFSAPGSVVDFSSGSGGGSVVSSDSFLRTRYVQLLATNGFLYLIADSSINYISGVQTSGTPPVTTFTNQNADPEVGTPWPSAVGTFGRNILFANAFGAHASYGAAVNKISDELDGIYNSLPGFGGLIPSTAKAIIFGKKVWVMLLPIIDPISGEQVNKLFFWYNQRWWASSQDVELVYIQSQEIDSVITAWGSDGTTIYKLFQTPTTAFTKVVQTKLWDKPLGQRAKKAVTRLWGTVQYYGFESPDMVVNIDNEDGAASEENQITIGPTEIQWETLTGDAVTWTVTPPGTPVTWFGAGVGVVVMDPRAVAQQGVYVGLTIRTDCDDMAVIAFSIPQNAASYRG